MSANEIVNALRSTVEIIDDPGNNVVLKMLKGHMTNAADLIESLQAQLAESQRRERAVVEFAISAEMDYMECDKMFIHLGYLKQAIGYNAYLVDAKQAGARPLTFRQWLRWPHEAGGRP